MSTKNLYHNSAMQKIKEMAEEIDFTMMTTNLKKTPLHVVPMSTKKVDENGDIWFLSNKDSSHNNNILHDNQLHLIYSDAGGMQFLNLFGEATITTKHEIINDLYQSSDDAWFNGKDDPNITAICVKPKEAFYWDPKSNTLVTLLKMGVGAITGSEPDLMDQGKIEV